MITPNSLIIKGFGLHPGLPFRLGKDLAAVVRKANLALHWLLPTGQ